MFRNRTSLLMYRRRTGVEDIIDQIDQICNVRAAAGTVYISQLHNHWGRTAEEEPFDEVGHVSYIDLTQFEVLAGLPESIRVVTRLKRSILTG